ncbi:type I restriction-modification system subunit M [Thomasclavelia cocleata]|uniref:site-specific DNA-methyltransferase (adenine-specific) n=1 Tax=Thomasclavelia cocleata TaxID=69824 RepID=A0A1I0HSU9_9FIRM|nr:type I restriction-modification system subunit M [Thomasclavelia cocleata]MCR1961924.1 type I restriction-modification system subunit M [Thomasclavelia cocleata]NDO40920.1 type I restriction-modification system subunit M [Thomasclavelia cocleata]PJN80857.1 type I restriction-modification system subunit M [Thomasclavelia cocleata]SET86240.1 type I restriction enzyme M protein [Thomasclavelia cocleata]
METQEIQAKQQAELHTQLWSMANDLRGNMDASEFKNYILGLIFYRYLSDKLLRFVNDELEEDGITYEEAWNNEDFKDDIIELLVDNEGGLGYIIEPNNLWSTLINKINIKQFDISMLAKAINDLTESTLGLGSQRDFENLFDDMDLNASKLGKTEVDRSALISKVMLKINDINFHYEDAEIDVLGDAYEYLIGQFAASAGKKAGEFYTPQQVSKLLAKLVTIGKKKLRNVYDPTCGSGSLLLRVAKEAEVVSFYGQEKVSTTYNLARMNMLLHGVRFNHFDIENNDTLEHPNEKHMELTFEAVVANPPYSAKWSADPKFLDDERFSGYGKLAPKSKADYAFIQHMLYLLDDSGTMAVVLPHGVLFRGAAEGVIRKYLIEEKNWLDAVIGLPANLFFGTSIPTCVLVFKKCKTHDDIFFIDASKEFESGKNQNRLTDENIEKIMNTYIERKDVDKYAHCATLEEIKENDFNLNIPRYVDTFEEEEEIDIHAVMKEIKELEAKRDELDKEIVVYLKELGLMED